MVGVAYTFSKTLDWEDNEELNALLFPFPAYMARNKALAGFDRTHNLEIYGVYDLPFGRTKRWAKHGIASMLAGGWQLNWLLTRASGTPLTLTGGGSSLNAPGNTQTVDQVGPISIVGGLGPTQIVGQPPQTCALSDLSCHYFDPSAFTGVPTGRVRFGTSGRNILRGPGLPNLPTVSSSTHSKSAFLENQTALRTRRVAKGFFDRINGINRMGTRPMRGRSGRRRSV